MKYLFSLDFEYRIELSTRPEDKYIGEIVKDWDESEAILEEVIKKTGKRIQDQCW